MREAVGVLRGIAAGSDLAEESEGRLVAALTALAGKGEGSAGEFESVLEPVGEDVRLAQIHQDLDKLQLESRTDLIASCKERGIA